MEMTRTVRCKQWQWKHKKLSTAIWLSTSFGQFAIVCWIMMNTFEPFSRIEPKRTNRLPLNFMASMSKKRSCLTTTYIHVFCLHHVRIRMKHNFNQKTYTKANRVVGIPWQPRGPHDVLPISSCPLVWFTHVPTVVPWAPGMSCLLPGQLGQVQCDEGPSSDWAGAHGSWISSCSA